MHSAYIAVNRWFMHVNHWFTAAFIDGVTHAAALVAAERRRATRKGDTYTYEFMFRWRHKILDDQATA